MAEHHEATPGHAHVHGGITMNPGAPAPPVPGHDDDHEAHHPSWKFYVMIGLVLTIITAAEVAIFYVPQLESILIPSLLIMSLAKFILVVMFYMHLKFDHAVLSRVFVAPLVLAVLVVIGMIILFKVLPGYDYRAG
jgi:cytochrome c oxidase subunit 4